MYTQLELCWRQSSETLRVTAAAPAMLILTGRSRTAGICQKIYYILWTFPAQLSDNGAWLGRTTILQDTWVHPVSGKKGETCHAVIPNSAVCFHVLFHACWVSVGQVYRLEQPTPSVRRSAALHGCGKETSARSVCDHVRFSIFQPTRRHGEVTSRRSAGT